MKFNPINLYDYTRCDAEIGSKGYFASSLKLIKKIVESGTKDKSVFGTLCKINDEFQLCRFVKKETYDNSYYYFYKVN